MEIDLAMIRMRFDALLSGRVTREEASNWARQLREADDRQGLVVVPESQRERIWDAIAFLESYDMKNSPTEYLYGKDDLIANQPSNE